MSSNLSSYFKFHGQNVTSEQVQSKDTIQSTAKQAGGLSQQSLAEIKQLIAGQTVSGEVLSIKGNEVELLLEKGGYLRAKIDSELTLLPGKLLSFEVKQNFGSQLILRPLFENLEQYPNVNKAIEAAGIPQTEKSIALVKELMRQGMPVDVNTLQNMHKTMLHFMELAPADLVQMSKLNLPVTSDMIQQFEQYKNLEHSVLKNIIEVANEFSDLVSEDIHIQSTPQNDLLQKLATIFSQGTRADFLTEQKFENILTQLGIHLEDNGRAQVSSNLGGENHAVMFQVNDFPEEGLDKNQNLAQVQLPDNSEVIRSASPESELETRIRQLITGERLPESLPAMLENKELSPYQLFRLTQEILSNSQLSVHEEWNTFVQSKEFQNILKDSLLSQWLIAPEQVGQEGKISSLYETMHSQTSKISQMLAAMDEKYASLLKQINSLTQNVDFMHHLNQVLQYVQLPLKMSDEAAHGELYVYSRKKSLAGSHDTISAFLHLDMEHLGKVDVYVTLQGEKVNTNFKLEDEACLKLIEDHLPILDEHLQKRGYQLHADLSISDTEVNLINEMISQDKGISLISEFSFDVRA